jgi:hypothetical protein
MYNFGNVWYMHLLELWTAYGFVVADITLVLTMIRIYLVRLLILLYIIYIYIYYSYLYHI